MYVLGVQFYVSTFIRTRVMHFVVGNYLSKVSPVYTCNWIYNRHIRCTVIIRQYQPFYLSLFHFRPQVWPFGPLSIHYVLANLVIRPTWCWSFPLSQYFAASECKTTWKLQIFACYNMAFSMHFDDVAWLSRCLRSPEAQFPSINIRGLLPDT